MYLMWIMVGLPKWWQVQMCWLVVACGFLYGKDLYGFKMITKICRQAIMSVYSFETVLGGIRDINVEYCLFARRSLSERF